MQRSHLREPPATTHTEHLRHTDPGTDTDKHKHIGTDTGTSNHRQRLTPALAETNLGNDVQLLRRLLDRSNQMKEKRNKALQVAET